MLDQASQILEQHKRCVRDEIKNTIAASIPTRQVAKKSSKRKRKEEETIDQDQEVEIINDINAEHEEPKPKKANRNGTISLKGKELVAAARGMARLNLIYELNEQTPADLGSLDISSQKPKNFL